MTGRGIARRDEMTAAWFDGLDQDDLLLRRCPAGHLSRPDVLACDICRDPSLTWVRAAGGGVVISVATDHAAGTSVVVVELDEGPWIVTCFESEVAERGERVRVHVVHPEEGEPFPVVVPAAVRFGH